jgi:hypothetical protein
VKRKILFSEPWAVTAREGTSWYAVVNGERVTGTYGQLKEQVKTARAAHQKRQRDAKRR